MGGHSQLYSSKPPTDRPDHSPSRFIFISIWPCPPPFPVMRVHVPAGHQILSRVSPTQILRPGTCDRATRSVVRTTPHPVASSNSRPCPASRPCCGFSSCSCSCSAWLTVPGPAGQGTQWHGLEACMYVLMSLSARRYLDLTLAAYARRSSVFAYRPNHPAFRTRRRNSRHTHPLETRNRQRSSPPASSCGFD